MLAQESNPGATNPPLPEPTSTDIQNNAGNTTNGLDPTKKFDLKNLRFKKNPRTEETTDERPVKRVKIETEAGPSQAQVISIGGDSGVKNGSEVGQNLIIETPVKVPKKRGRPAKAKGDDQVSAPKVVEKDTPVKKLRASKVKAEDGAQILSGEKDTPTKRTRAPKTQPETGEGSVKKTLTRKEHVAKSKELAKLEPKWTVVPSSSEPTVKPGRENLVQTTQRPRIWMSNREELLSVLPEMTGSKCFNGVSWELYETPILVFDEANTAFQLTCKDGDPRSIVLVTTRKFVAPLQRKEPPPVQQTEPGPVPDQSQVHAPVAAPAAEDYLARMEPTLYRFTSADPEILPHFDRGHAAQSVIPQTELPPPTNTTTFIPEPPLETTRINFSAPLPMFRALSAKSDYIDSSIDGSIHWTGTSNGWEPNRTLPLGLPVANVVTQQTSEMDVTSTVNPAPQKAFFDSERERKSILFPFPPETLLARPDTDSTTTTASQPTSNTGTKKKKYSKEESNTPRRSSTRLLNLANSNSLVAQPVPKPFVRPSDNNQNNNNGGTAQDSSVLSVPPNSVHPDSNPLDAQKSLVEQSSVVTTPLPAAIDQDVNGKQTQNDIGAADDGPITVAIKSEAVAEILNPTPSLTNGHHADNLIPADTTTGSQTDSEFIPSPLPKEIQAMIDAYLFGGPLTLIASREHLQQHWSLLLPEDFGYAMMGYFKIIGVQEKRVEETDLPKFPVGLQSTTGYVQWSFHLEWRPGGEEYIMPKLDLQLLECPWWEPPPEKKQTEPSSDAVTNMKIEQQEKLPIVPREIEAEFPTTPRYLQARLAHPEYRFRHDPFRELYECLLPTFLLAPYGPQVLDSMLARGWYCKECGKVNYQTTLRQRRCSSMFCKEKKAVIEPYALELYEIRDPQDRLPNSFPYNIIPPSMVTNVKTYDGGIKTVSYSLQGGIGALVYHVFTGNVPSLQEHATALLKQIQLDVELKRPFNDNTPYFSYVAKRPSKGKKKDSIDAPWEDVPSCINDAKKHLASRAGELTDVEKSRISITQIKLLGWVAAGSRAGPDILRATKKCIVLLSFGCDIVLTLTPRFVEQTTSAKNAVIEETSNGATADSNTSGDVAAKQESVKAPKIKALKKSEKLSIVLYLVHGDCIVLDGDDFEYSIKRDGTSFLMIASHHEKKI